MQRVLFRSPCNVRFAPFALQRSPFLLVYRPLRGAASNGEERSVGYHYDAKHTVGVSGHSRRFFYPRRVIRSTCLGEFHG